MILNPLLTRLTLWPAVVLFAVAGCKPAPPVTAGQPAATPMPSAAQPTPVASAAGGTAVRQPTAADFQAFFQGLFPAGLRVAEVKSDPPVPMPDTAPADNAWLLRVKLTLVPTEDLLALPSQADADAINALVSSLNEQVTWRNAYVRSAYAHTYGSYDVQVPAGPVPQLLVVTQPKDQPLPALYGKVAAEWQVDHWQFTNIDLALPPLGERRAKFIHNGPTMVKGSPEAEAFLAAERKAIADARQQQASVEDRFAKDLAAATRLGMVYKGRITHPDGGSLACEVRFTDGPGAGGQVATFEVHLPQQPAYLFTYSARLASKLPLNLADAPAAFAAAGNADQDVPLGNLTVSCTHSAGKASISGNPAGVMVSGSWTLANKPFLLFGGHLQGVVASFNGDFTLAAEQTR